MHGPATRRTWIIRAVVAAVAIGLFAFRDQLPSFSVEELVKDLSNGLGNWTYVLVGGLAFLETGAFVGLVAPGEFTVLLGGAVAGQGDISLGLILGITWAAAFAGDSASFALGAKLGRAFIIRHGPKLRISEARLAGVERYFSRHGGKTILIGRFIGLVRALAPFIAGSSKMPYRAFAPYSILGTGIWATALILLGYFASQNLDRVAGIVGRSLLAFGFAVFAVIGIAAAVRHMRQPQNRRALVEAMERRPALRPALALARRLEPEARFLWERVTPGGLGLELTTLLAVAAVATYFLGAYWSIVIDNPAPTGWDSSALDLADQLRMGWLDGVAKAISLLGSTGVILILGIVLALALLATARWGELIVLVVGLLVVFIGTDLIKDATDRPRPVGGLLDTQGSAFPSGHAAHAVLYSWIAATLAVRVVPGITRGGLVIVAGLVLTALIGLSRVYLGVHWLSDVSAGWGLGFAAYSMVAAIVLVVGHIRQNLSGIGPAPRQGDFAPPGPRL